MKKIIFSLLALTLFVSGLVPLSATAAAHNAGTNIKTSNGTIYLITQEGTRRPYNSAGAFTSYGFNSWANVKVATSEDLSLPIGSNVPPQDGKIICDTKQRAGTCYLITMGSKIGFPSADIFTKQGFSFSKVIYGDASFLGEKQNIQAGNEAHQAGVLINKNGTVYLVGVVGLIGISDLTTFNSWGYNFSDVVVANEADFNFSVSGTLPFRQPGQLSPLDVSGTSATSNQSWQPKVAISAYSPSGTIYSTGGKNDLFTFVISAPKDRDFTVKQLSFEFNGTLPYSYLSNIKIIHYETGKEVGSNSGNVLSANSGGYAVSPPLIIVAGGSAEFIIRGDILSGTTGYTLQTKLTEVWTSSTPGLTSLAVVAGLPLTGPIVSVQTYSYAKKLTVTSPVNEEVIQAGSTKKITWTTTSATVGDLTITLMKKKNTGGFSPQQVITTSAPNVGYYLWNLSSDLPNGQYYIYIANPQNYNFYDDSDGEFTIKNPSIVNSSIFVPDFYPNNILEYGSLQNILWTDSGFCMQSSGGLSACPTSQLYSIYLLTDSNKNQYQAGSDPTSLAYFLGSVSMTSGSGKYSWYSGDAYLNNSRVSLSTTQNYYVLVTKVGTKEFGSSATPFTFQTVGAQRDAKRLSEIRNFASALELYFNDFNSYPPSLDSLMPKYIGVLYTGPTPADGLCSTSQNNYTYNKLNGGSSYYLAFCLGQNSGGYNSGTHILSPAGIQ